MSDAGFEGRTGRAYLDGTDGPVLSEEHAEGSFGYRGGEVSDVDVGRERVARVERAGEDWSVLAGCEGVKRLRERRADDGPARAVTDDPPEK